MQRLTAAIALFLACTFAVVTAQEPPPDLTGIWQVSGEDGDQAYHGVLMLERRDDGTYRATVATFGAATRGIGILKGGVLSVAWIQPAGDGIAAGLTVYDVSAAGKKLDGEWRTIGPGKSPRIEKAKWVAKLKPSET